MLRVLVTGATGFIGHHCLEALVGRADEVHAVSSRDVGAYGPATTWHRADLLDGERAAALVRDIRPTHLLHLAWFSGHREIYTSPENNRWVPASFELVREFRRLGGVRAVLGGTCAEYDWSEGICSEQRTPLRPATTYGAAKVALFRAYSDWVERTGFSGAWARVFFLFGPGEPEKRLLASVIGSILRGEPALCTHGEQRRDYLYVGDVADALVRLLESDVTGPVNIASGEAPRLKELVMDVARKLGREDLVRLGAIAAPEGEAPLVQAEVGRLVGEVGWHMRYGLDQGLDKTIEYWSRMREAERGEVRS